MAGEIWPSSSLRLVGGAAPPAFDLSLTNGRADRGNGLAGGSGRRALSVP